MLKSSQINQGVSVGEEIDLSSSKKKGLYSGVAGAYTLVIRKGRLVAVEARQTVRVLAVRETLVREKAELVQAVRTPPEAPLAGLYSKLSRRRGRKEKSLGGEMSAGLVSCNKMISAADERSSDKTSPHLTDSPKPLTF